MKKLLIFALMVMCIITTEDQVQAVDNLETRADQLQTVDQ